MSSKLLGVLNSLSQQISVERTSAPAVGAQVITLDDAPYFASDRGHDETRFNDTAAVMDTATAHPFLVTDTLTIWRPSTDAIVFSDTAIAVAPNSVTFANVHTWLVGDIIFVSDDLIGYIVARVRSQNAGVGFDEFDLTLADGIASSTFGGAVNGIIVWPTTTLQTWLRYSGTVTVTAGAESPDPDQQMEGMLWLDKNVQRDMLSIEPFASQSRTVSGVVETLYRSQLRNRQLKLRTTGPPRSSLKTVYQAGEDFWSSHLARGLRWRYYVDTDEEQPYVKFANPRGYEVMVAPIAQFAPKPMQGGNDNHIDWAFLVHEYIAG